MGCLSHHPEEEPEPGLWASQQEAVLKATAVRSPLRRQQCHQFFLVHHSSLSSSSTSHAVWVWQGEGVWWGRGVQWGEGGLGEGQGTFHPSCHILHYHTVLRPKGTSHNQRVA